MLSEHCVIPASHADCNEHVLQMYQGLIPLSASFKAAHMLPGSVLCLKLSLQSNQDNFNDAYYSED